MVGKEKDVFNDRLIVLLLVEKYVCILHGL